MNIYLLVLGGALGKVGGGSERVGLLHHVSSGVNSKADKARHVEGLHNAVPAVPSEPLIIPRHILTGGYDVWLITLQRQEHRQYFLLTVCSCMASKRKALA